MKITVSQNNLINILELVSRVSTKHVTLPVLQCVLITVTESVITCTTTNLEIRLEAILEGTISEPGVVAVPAQTLLQAVQYATQKNLEISVSDGVLHIDTGRGKTTINTIAYEEFPSATKIEQSGSQIQRESFSQGIKSVAFAASVSSIKPELGSIYIQQKKEQSLTFVATDSFRLMEKTVPQKGFVLDQNMLLPQKNAVEIARICDSLNSNPTLSITENLCALSFEEGVYVTSRLVSGSFPDYEQIIPKEYKTNCTLLTADFTQGLKKTSIFLNKFMQVTLTISENTFTLSAQSGDAGATTESLRATVEGDDLVLNFNQRYISDVLQHIQSDSMHLKCAGVGRPMVIQNLHDDSLRYLVMPMNK